MQHWFSHTVALACIGVTIACGATLTPEDSAFIALQCQLIASQRWYQKPIGVLCALVAQLFIGKPYQAGTLEAPGPEEPRFTSSGFDCVTLTESAIALSRIARRSHSAHIARDCTPANVLRELERLRYRGGTCDGSYLSRLHYTSEWIADNVARGTFEDITAMLGGKRIRKRINFMSRHPELYARLRDSAELVNRLAAIEQRLSQQPMTIIPLTRLQRTLERIQSGDIIAIASATDGLDYAHMGIALRSQGKLGLIHASSKAGKVVFEPDLASYLRSQRTITGITVLRLREPQAR